MKMYYNHQQIGKKKMAKDFEDHNERSKENRRISGQKRINDKSDDWRINNTGIMEEIRKRGILRASIMM